MYVDVPFRKTKIEKLRKTFPDIGLENIHINFRKYLCKKTLSKIGITERLEEFSKYFELKKDKIRLKYPKFEKLRKNYPDNGPKNTHIKYQKDRSMGALS